MDAARFRSIQEYVDFDAASAQHLKSFLEVARPYLAGVVEDFYWALSRDTIAVSAITGGNAQVERLKATLHVWLVSLLSGPYDETYVVSRNRIGRVHVRINLAQEYMLTAVNRVRFGLLNIVAQHLSGEEAHQTAHAINRALDLDLALMLDTYREDSASRVDASARLAAIGQVAASIGHELRNPLGVAESSIYLLGQRLKKLGLQDPTLDKHATRVQEQLKVCSDTITALLDMVREAPLLRSHFQLAPLVREVWQRTPHGGGVELSLDVPLDRGVFADREQIGQVLSNLFRNAVEAVGTAPVKRISVWANPTVDGTEIFVQDSGAGVGESYRDRIFDVLFTTRAKGTGLGLALCRKITERHGGEIRLEPADASGARFRLWLPAADVAGSVAVSSAGTSNTGQAK
jgi:two-component system, NtrC family, sensor histidine kinase HydH